MSILPSASSPPSAKTFEEIEDDYNADVLDVLWHRSGPNDLTYKAAVTFLTRTQEERERLNTLLAARQEPALIPSRGPARLALPPHAPSSNLSASSLHPIPQRVPSFNPGNAMASYLGSIDHC